MSSRSGLTYMDFSLIIIVLSMMAIGWITIFAVEYQGTFSGMFDSSTSAGKQLRWIGISLAAGAVILLLDTRFFTLLAYPLYVFSLILLVITVFFGTEVSGSRSWLDIGGLRFQTPELAKFTTALALARFLSKSNTNLIKLTDQLVAMLMVGIPAFIIVMQNETGSALVYAGFFIVLYRAGQTGFYLITGLVAIVLFIVSLLYPVLFVILGLFLISGIVIWLNRKRRSVVYFTIIAFMLASSFSFSVNYVFEEILLPHQKSRINVLLGQEQDVLGAAYNLNQSLIAIGSGGLTGKGFLQGTQTKFNFVPEQNTDFIFCTIGEEFGFVGSIFIIGIFMVLLLRITHISERQRSSFSSIFGYGVAAILFMHMAINIGMTIGLMPIIGIPLPFISYGGSSLLIFTAMIFVFIRLDADRLFVLR